MEDYEDYEVRIYYPRIALAMRSLGSMPNASCADLYLQYGGFFYADVSK